MLHERKIHGAQRSADGAAGMIIDALDIGCVLVEIGRTCRR